ncbi:hypothetical protein ACR3K2_36150 [Cryptosporidium serpentis]
MLENNTKHLGTLHFKFSRNYEYIHSITADDTGDYFVISCTNSLIILKRQDNEFIPISSIRSPHDGATTSCAWSPLYSTKYALFATCSDDKTVGIWLLNKNINFSSIKKTELIDYQSISKGPCILTAKLRDAKLSVTKCCFAIMDGFNNDEATSLNSLSSCLLLFTCSEDGYIRVYIAQDPPTFLLWTIKDQFSCHINNPRGCLTFSLKQHKPPIIINNSESIYTYIFNQIVVGGFDGTFKIFAQIKILCDSNSNNQTGTEIIEDKNMTPTLLSPRISSPKKIEWKLIYETCNQLSTNESILDVSWCPNYCRKYDILATSHDSTSSPWIGIWRWEIIDELSGNLILLQKLFTNSSNSSICLSWNTSGTELIASTYCETIRYLLINDKYTRYNHTVDTKSSQKSLLTTISNKMNYSSNCLYFVRCITPLS